MEQMEKEREKQRIWQYFALFLGIFILCVLLQAGPSWAMPVPESTYTPTDGGALTYTFTGDSSAPLGVYANVESYRSPAISSDGQLTIPRTIKYPNPGQDITGVEGDTVDIEVRGILRGVFSGATTLTTLSLPDTMSYIGQEAFSNCTNLRSIQTLPEPGAPSAAPLTGYLTAQQIEYRAFYGCTSLTGLVLGEKNNGYNGVNRVENEAFMDCTSLRSLEIGPTVNWIEGGAFAGCTSLDGLSGGVKVRNNPLYFIQGGIIYYRENNLSNVLSFCPAGTQVGMLTEFPQNVTQIRNQAFYGCGVLASIVIPDTVRAIGDRAFYNCYGLGNVTIPANVATIGTEVFANCSNGLCIICISNSMAERYAISNNITRSVECTVTFYNTHTRETTTRKVMSGQTVDPPVGWERTGYVLRWTDNFDSSTIVNANRTVSTVWKKLYNVTFRDAYSGSESVVSGVEEGTEAAAPNWKRKGYRLTWSTENYKIVSSDLTVDAVWLVDLTQPGETEEQPKKGDTLTIGNINYKISSMKDMRVRVMGLKDITVKNVAVPNTISFKGKTFDVTCINANAFRNNKYIEKVTLGTKMRSIEHYAFYNCSKLKKFVIKSKVLVNFSNYAFKRSLASLKVYVPTNALKSTYREGMIDAGLNKSAKVVLIP